MTPPPPPKTLIWPSAALFEEVDHIFEIFDMPALIGGNGDALHVFLNGGVDDFIDRSVVAEMNDLSRTIEECAA